jgi:hypothetical protein
VARTKTGPNDARRVFGPQVSLFLNINVLFLLFLLLCTTTACAHDTPANAIPLACKHKPGVGFSSPISNQHHTHPPHSKTQAEGGFTHHYYHISKITTPFQSSFDTFLTLSLFEHFYDNL